MQNIKKIFTYLVVGALVTALYMSCKSNEDPGSGPLEVSEEGGNSKDITINTNNSEVRTGTVGFSVSVASDYNVSIQSVDNGSNPLSLDASDFIYDKSSKELTLKESCITNKLNNANLTQATPYEYTITFKVVDSSDTSKEKTIDVKVNLYNAQVIGKTPIENMFRSKFTVSDTEFDCSAKNFDDDEPNFDVSIYYGEQTPVSLSISAVSDEIIKKLTDEKNEKYNKFFSACNFNNKKISDDKRSLTLYIKFTLKGGYALSSEVAHLTSYGLSIKLTLQNGQTWE